MKVLRTDRSHKDFYRWMGPIFGSREIEKKSRDRFYDDPGKVWYLLPGQAAASVLGSTIKNFWADTEEDGTALLKEICPEYECLDGIVPLCYQESFEKMGFQCQRHRVHFMEVYYEKD